ncbi:hypothetical protein V6N12_069731 [Hibiscus sabdariffa]|uniref:Uncharacterized protein n=1 Tax=Hibiscus sabdariffa TaxID=183260 RepID=A0ABR2FEW5_9ROSI
MQGSRRSPRSDAISSSRRSLHSVKLHRYRLGHTALQGSITLGHARSRCTAGLGHARSRCTVGLGHAAPLGLHKADATRNQRRVLQVCTKPTPPASSVL